MTITSKKKKTLNNKAGKLWKQAVFLHYGEICLSCGKRKANHPHHFVAKSRNGLLKYTLENGIPLCASCHWKIHFSPSPTETYRRVVAIRKRKGEKWCKWIDGEEKKLGRSFNTISWIQQQIDTLLRQLEGI